MATLTWVNFTGNGPDNMVEGGHRGNGEKTYVARASIGGEMAIGKCHGNSSYIPWNGKENNVSPFQVLVCDTPELLTWVPARNGDVPDGAIDGGHRQDMLPFYVGQAQHDTELLPGKVFPLDKCIYVGTGWKTYSETDYNVLVAKAYVLPSED